MSRLRAAFEEGRTAFGAWLMMSSPVAVEVIATIGFDYVCIDGQHGLLAYEQMRDMLLVLKGDGPSPLVRVPANDLASIGKALDAGAEGVIVPLVNSGAEALAAARACRYPPDGNRSFGPARAHQLPPTDVMCFPMIETNEGLTAANEIAATPGITGVYIGPADLGFAIGHAIFSDEHEAACAQIRDACVGRDVIPAMHASGGDQAKQRADQGFRMVTVIDDGSMLRSGGRSALDIARG